MVEWARATKGRGIGRVDTEAVSPQLISRYRLCQEFGVGDSTLVREVLSRLPDVSPNAKGKFSPKQARLVLQKVEELRRQGILLPRRNNR